LIEDVRALLGWEAVGELESAPALLLQTPAAMDESARSELNSRLLSARTALEQAQAATPEHSEVLVLLAEIATRTQSWDQAAVLWNRVVNEVSALADVASLKLCVAYRQLGSYVRARLALGRIRPESVDPGILRAERRKLLAGETGVALRLLGNTVTDALARSETDPDLEYLLRAIRRLRRGDDVFAECLVTVAEGVRGYKPLDPTPWWRRKGQQPAAAVEHSPRCLFLSGFGWSGSGALYDYLRQAETVATPFDNAEIWAFERNWCAKKVLDAVREDPTAARRALVYFIFQSVLGVSAPMTIDPARIGRQSIMHFAGRTAGPAIAAACLTLFDRGMAAASRSGLKPLEEALRRFFDEVIEAKAGPGRVSVMSNCITAANVDLARLVSNGVALVVFRDPRDQFVSQYYEYKNRQNLSCETFIRKVRSRTDRYRRAKRALAGKAAVEEVQFEQFVLSKSYRDALLERVGVSPDLIPVDGPGYRPEHSMKNVGLYQNFPRVADIKRIEDDLGDLLFQG
jgi:hypothetical protein